VLATPQKSPADFLDALRENVGQVRLRLVEDDPVNQEVVRMFREPRGCETEAADDGAQSVAKVATAAYHLILMDMLTPVMDMIEATRHIRVLANGKRVPFLALTANAFSENRERCLLAGMNDFVTKPLTPRVLYALVLRWLAPRAASAES
jgi:two-component system, sensor histidine kinase and response regulator